MKTEISAGGIIVTKQNNQWYVLLLKDMNGNWTFPKGIIEKGETAEQAAVREIAEEVGVKNLTLLAPLSSVSYYFTRDETIHKTVHYFVFSSSEKQATVPQTEEGISEVVWLPFDEAMQKVSYPKTNKPLLEETKKLIYT